jgi:hypothetical protein
VQRRADVFHPVRRRQRVLGLHDDDGVETAPRVLLHGVPVRREPLARDGDVDGGLERAEARRERGRREPRREDGKALALAHAAEEAEVAEQRAEGEVRADRVDRREARAARAGRRRGRRRKAARGEDAATRGTAHQSGCHPRSRWQRQGKVAEEV